MSNIPDVAKQKLISPDSSETFTLYVTNIDTTISNNLILDDVGALTNRLVAYNVNIATRERVITINIGEHITSDDYPNSSKYDNDAHGYTVELEKAINRWANVIQGKTTFEWNRGGYLDEIEGVWSDLNHNISSQNLSDEPDSYQATITFNQVDNIGN